MEQLPKRKRLRLQDYDYSQNGAYFITICTQNKRKVLCDIVGDDAHIVPKPCGQVVEKYICNVPEITKYVIMPNHIHMIIELDSGTMWASSPTKGLSDNDVGADTLIRPKENAIASIIRSLKTLTTKEIGVSIFQRSYYDHIIRNEQDYWEIWRYIDENPAKWKMDRFYE